MHAIMDVRERTVGELAAEMPLSIRVFEAWKIDYCCGGMTPLPEACAAAGKSVDAFIETLEKLVAVPDGSTRDWTAETLSSMSANIVSTYHVWTREELQTLEASFWIAPLSSQYPTTESFPGDANPSRPKEPFGWTMARTPLIGAICPRPSISKLGKLSPSTVSARCTRVFASASP